MVEALAMVDLLPVIVAGHNLEAVTHRRDKAILKRVAWAEDGIKVKDRGFILQFNTAICVSVAHIPERCGAP